jgi:hypothetical protein
LTDTGNLCPSEEERIPPPQILLREWCKISAMVNFYQVFALAEKPHPMIVEHLDKTVPLSKNLFNVVSLLIGAQLGTLLLKLFEKLLNKIAAMC